MLEKIDIQQGDGVFIMDLEWIGNSMIPSQTHITEIACMNALTKEVFHRHLTTLSNNDHGTKPITPAADALASFVNWLAESQATQIYLAAHNGIRFDAPVLRNALLKYNVSIPPSVYVVDTLYHIRYHLPRASIRLRSYSIDHLAQFCCIPNDPEKRHTALYDVCLLAQIMDSLMAQYGIPIVSGSVQPLNTISAMVVHGIGPSINEHLPGNGLLELCEQVLSSHGDLSTASCKEFLHNLGLDKKLPLLNIDMAARNIQACAERYLQYIE